MDPMIWGPAVWFILSDLANYIDNQDPTADLELDHYWIALLYSLQYALPCEMCRVSYRMFLHMFPPESLARGESLRFIYECHDAINQKLGKKSIPFEMYEARIASYEVFASPLLYNNLCQWVAQDVLEESNLTGEQPLSPTDLREHAQRLEGVFIFYNVLHRLLSESQILKDACSDVVKNLATISPSFLSEPHLLTQLFDDAAID